MNDAVVRLGAWCDLIPAHESRNSPGSVSISVDEFADLADGRRLSLNTFRSFAVSGPVLPSDDDPLAGMTADAIEMHARNAVMPEDVDGVDEHPYEQIQSWLHQAGVDTTSERLRQVPYTVELSPRLQALSTRRERS